MSVTHHLHSITAAGSALKCSKHTGSSRPYYRCRRVLETNRAITLTGPDGSSRTFDQDTVTVGSKSNADLQVSSSNIAGEHAEIFQKGGRTYCKATAGDEEDMTSSSYTWLDSSESQLRTGDVEAVTKSRYSWPDSSESHLRTGVSYLLAPKAHLAFGEAENKYEVDFEETNTGGTAMFEMLMQGMTAKASDDVRNQMKDRIG